MLGLAQLLLSPDLLPLVGNFFRRFLILGYNQFITGLWNIVKAHQLYRCGGTGFFYALAMLILHGTHPTEAWTRNKGISYVKCPILNQYICNGTLAFIHAGFQDNAVGTSIRVGFQFHQFGLDQDLFKKIVYAITSFC